MMLILLLSLTTFAADRTEKGIFSYQDIWLDQNGRETQLKRFSDSPFLISMVFTTCPHSCPMTISKVQEIKKALKAEGWENIPVVLASFDDQGDTPDVLKKFLVKRKLDEKEWTMLSPKSQKEARELAVILGISFKKIGPGDFSHSNVISLVNRSGEIVAKIDHLSGDVSVFKKGIKK